MEYGLIGYPLGHSYSKVIHEELCDYTYELAPQPTPADAHAFFAARQFKAVNVTIPYKQLVMDHCDVIDEKARAIHAVNTVVNRGGRLYGYNTDYPGLCYLLDYHGIALAGRTVLLLGTGGAHHTARAVAEDRGAAAVYTVSRDPGPGQMSYAEAATSDAQVVINTSPAGMYPKNGGCLLALDRMPRLEAVVDVVYNPFRTELVLRAEERGVAACSGFEMLVGQAVYAVEHFLGTPFADPEAEIRRVHAKLRREIANIVLIGMPGSGKTTLGRLLAEKTGKMPVDLDSVVEAEAGCTIAELFSREGEAGFRARETAAAAKFGRENRQVISCGGGIVKNPENIRLLRQNGVILHVRRPLESLTLAEGRPLSQSRADVEALWQQRAGLYAAAQDAEIQNDTTIESALAAAMEALDEIFDPERG